MPDPYHAFRQDLVSSLRQSAQAARAPTKPGLLGAPPPQLDPADYIPVDTSGVGEFPWEWDNLGTFNANTWTFLNTTATKSDQGFVQLKAGLTTWYFNIINATAYLWTDADRATLNTHLSAAQQAQEQMISDYQSMFTPISPADKQTAAAALGLSAVSNLTYVVDYQIAYRWSGHEAAGLPPLSASDIRAAQLDTLFAKAPPKAKQALLPSLRAALKHEEDWATHIDRLWNTSRAIREAVDNTHQPDVTNQSGMYTVDLSGNTIVRHSFAVAPSVSDIRTKLSSPHTMQVSFSANRTAQGDTVVAMTGSTPSQVPEAVIATQDGKGTNKTLFAHDGTGDRAEVTITYHGPAEITVTATPFGQKNATGWFYEHPITEAATNQARNISTGYQFQIPISTVQGGSTGAGLLQKLLVCRQVTLAVVYPNGDLQRLSQSVPTGAGVSATLMGELHLKHSPDHPVTAQVQLDQATGAPSLVMTAGPPGTAGTPGPLAHVIGARVNHPFPQIAPAIRHGTPELHLLATNALTAAPESTPVNALVTAYERIFGPIPASQLSATGSATKEAFITDHVLGAEWSGQQKAGKPALTLTRMRAARNLRSLFPDMPLAGAALLTELHSYLGSG